ncbi:caspase family protein [Streptomyces sp. NPDC047046]|uniref:HD domain-containing protein n=1 Tax=Streptomyces sp. NPDC047046 TaxID=3155378 RepID=UPI0033F33165
MAGVRRALLMGVTETPRARDFPALPHVTQDLAMLQKALDGAGFSVATPLTNPSKDDMAIAIEEMVRELADGDLLLLYFSGHGIRLGEEDRLLSSATQAPATGGTWTKAAANTLFSVDIAEWMDSKPAGAHVLWIVDACRDRAPGDVSENFGRNAERPRPGTGRAGLGAALTWLGCEPEQRSHYAPEGSYFTRGLADALDVSTPPRTVREVFAHAQAYTVGLAGSRNRQHPREIAADDGIGDLLGDLVLCEGRDLYEPWQRAVRNSPLWARVEPGEEAVTERMRTTLLAFLRTCAEQRIRIESALTGGGADPWLDKKYPQRLLGELADTLLREDAKLSPLEVAALLAAPFIHDLACTQRLALCREFEPTREEAPPDLPPEAREERAEWERLLAAHANMARRLRQFTAEGPADRADELRWWLLHRQVADAIALDGDKKFTCGPGADRHVEDLAQALCGERASASHRDRVLAELYRLAAVLTERGDPPATEQSVRLHAAEGAYDFRAAGLARMLRLAATLAIDVRTLPGPLGDHLGAPDDELTAAQVRDAANDVRWYPHGDFLAIDYRCPHPALHSALDEVVARADRIVQEAARHPQSPPLLPRRVTDLGELRPAESLDSTPRYDLPLARFHLAHDKVRELLMGAQLYEDPQAALRELFQNALDACRYRGQRLLSAGGEPGWEGRIRFSQGRTEDGRPYVECADNGVGLDKHRLESLFTRAGSRFEDSREFRRERRRWEAEGHEVFHPNSRFGIGVFSYFMLADSMTIVTRPTNEEGIPADKALRVHISGSDSLLRIRRASKEDAEGTCPQGGTLVRLYLREPFDRELSVGRAFRSFLAVSEFELVVEEEGREDIVYPKGELCSTEAINAAGAIAVPGEPMWWVNGRGAVLCDGILTDQEPFGYVVDLRGDKAGTLNVNRKRLLDWDREWVRDLWEQGADVLREGPWLGLGWLWELEEQSVVTARVLWERWRGTDVRVRLPGGPAEFSLDALGWCLEDQRTSEGLYSSHELRAWRHKALDSTYPPYEVPPGRTDTYPLAGPGLTALSGAGPDDWRDMVKEAAEQGIPLDGALDELRRLRPVDPQLGPPAVIKPPGRQVNAELAAVLAGSAGPQRDSGLSPEPEEPHGLLLWAYRQNLTLGAALADLAVYECFMEMPQIPDSHRERYVSRREAEVLCPGGELHEARPHPQDVLRWAREARVPVAVALQALRDYSWLGWVAPKEEHVTLWGSLSEQEAGLLLAHFHPERGLSWVTALALAASRGIPPQEAEAEVKAWAGTLGVPYTEAPGPAFADLRPGPPAAAVLTTHPWLVDASDVNNLVRDNWFEEDRRDGFTNELAVLETYGLPLSPRGKVARAREQGGVPAVLRLLREDTEVAALGLTVSRPTTLMAVHETGGDAKAVLPALPGKEICKAMTQQVDDALWRAKDGRLTAFGFSGLAKDALQSPRDFYAALAAWSPYGFPLPALTEVQRDSLPDTVPSQRDIERLATDNWAAIPYSLSDDAPLLPLDLLSIASRLGESPRETWSRIGPYIPFMPTPPLIAEAHVPEALPTWEDFAILSVHMDGRRPALERVTRAHLAFASTTVGKSTAWVVERLRAYSDFCGLTWDEDIND